MREHSKSRSRRYYDKKRSRSRSRERSHHRRSDSPNARYYGNNKIMSEKLKKTIQKQLTEAKTDIKNMSEKETIQTTNILKPESLSINEQMKRANDIQDINCSKNFEIKDFLSAQTISNQMKTMATLSLSEIPLPPSLNWKENPEIVLHPNLFESQEVKTERWIRKLMALRRKLKKSEKHLDGLEDTGI